MGDLFGGGYSTACYRDSIASYEIANGFLVLKEGSDTGGFDDIAAFCIFRHEDDELPSPPRYKPGTVIPFTGQLIITYGGRFMDFFRCIFDADRALELEFNEGRFMNATDLKSFIRAGKKYLEAQLENGSDQSENRVLPTDTEQLIEVLRNFSPVILKGHYTKKPPVGGYLIKQLSVRFPFVYSDNTHQF